MYRTEGSHDTADDILAIPVDRSKGITPLSFQDMEVIQALNDWQKTISEDMFNLVKEEAWILNEFPKIDNQLISAGSPDLKVYLPHMLTSVPIHRPIDLLQIDQLNALIGSIHRDMSDLREEHKHVKRLLERGVKSAFRREPSLPSPSPGGSASAIPPGKSSVKEDMGSGFAERSFQELRDQARRHSGATILSPVPPLGPTDHQRSTGDTKVPFSEEAISVDEKKERRYPIPVEGEVEVEGDEIATEIEMGVITDSSSEEISREIREGHIFPKKWEIPRAGLLHEDAVPRAPKPIVGSHSVRAPGTPTGALPVGVDDSDIGNADEPSISFGNLQAPTLSLKHQDARFCSVQSQILDESEIHLYPREVSLRVALHPRPTNALAGTVTFPEGMLRVSASVPTDVSIPARKVHRDEKGKSDEPVGGIRIRTIDNVQQDPSVGKAVSMLGSAAMIAMGQSTVVSIRKGDLARAFSEVEGSPKVIPKRDIPAYQEGGVVEKTGLAYVHEGEIVVPKDQAAAILPLGTSGDGSLHPVLQLTPPIVSSEPSRPPLSGEQKYSLRSGKPRGEGISSPSETLLPDIERRSVTLPAILADIIPVLATMGPIATFPSASPLIRTELLLLKPSLPIPDVSSTGKILASGAIVGDGISSRDVSSMAEFGDNGGRMPDSHYLTGPLSASSGAGSLRVPISFRSIKDCPAPSGTLPLRVKPTDSSVGDSLSLLSNAVLGAFAPGTIDKLISPSTIPGEMSPSANNIPARGEIPAPLQSLPGGSDRNMNTGAPPVEPQPFIGAFPISNGGKASMISKTIRRNRSFQAAIPIPPYVPDRGDIGDAGEGKRAYRRKPESPFAPREVPSAFADAISLLGKTLDLSGISKIPRVPGPASVLQRDAGVPDPIDDGGKDAFWLRSLKGDDLPPPAPVPDPGPLEILNMLPRTIIAPSGTILEKIKVETGGTGISFERSFQPLSVRNIEWGKSPSFFPVEAVSEEKNAPLPVTGVLRDHPFSMERKIPGGRPRPFHGMNIPIPLKNRPSTLLGTIRESSGVLRSISRGTANLMKDINSRLSPFIPVLKGRIMDEHARGIAYGFEKARMSEGFDPFLDGDPPIPSLLSDPEPLPSNIVLRESLRVLRELKIEDMAKLEAKERREKIGEHIERWDSPVMEMAREELYKAIEEMLEKEAKRYGLVFS